ncbi:LysE/ArgO family amino acid transporter [Arthrobacter sp. KK5.5]|uniref:LysE/ArgO family amino acid transporter n=1 Tax=Arthrobacter sp. KK5.5 TaxID=3373084 RepID=UPI003EE6891F
MPFLSSALPGFGTGISLIAAIGTQNAFVLRQGILRRHVGTVVAVCILSDAALILAGTAGMGALVEAAPWAMTAARICGAVFLLGYAALALVRAFRPAALTVEGDAAGADGTVGRASWMTALLTCLALTWLNPHVYLDTVVLLGSVASTHGAARWVFAAGAVVASVVWFVVVGYGARALRGLFARPVAWRVLDAVVAAVMIAIAWSLVAGIPALSPG